MHCTKYVRFGAITIALLDILVYVWALVQIWTDWDWCCLGLIYNGSSTQNRVIATIIYAGVQILSILLVWGLANRKNHHFLPWLTIRGIHLTVLGVAYLLLSTDLIAQLVNWASGQSGIQWAILLIKYFCVPPIQSRLFSSSIFLSFLHQSVSTHTS